MREAIRRALWILPTIFVVNVLAFWALARGAPAPHGEEGLPLLLNPRPIHLERLAWSAALASARGGTNAPRAEELLVRLGGAALPYLLPRFDALEPTERRRVALALMPVAVRMQLDEAREIEDGEQAERFWVGFWQDHFLDFRPSVTRRVTSRFADRATPLRSAELLRLDTYALDELVRQMSLTRDPDVLQRLCAAAAHVAEKPWTLPANATPRDVERLVETWQSWWARHRTKYSESQGLARLFEPVLQTRYGLWLAEAWRTRLGWLASGERTVDALRRTARTTLPSFAIGLLGGGLLGVALLALLRSRSRLGSRAASAAALLWLGLPTVALIALGRTLSSPGGLLVPTALVLFSGSAIALLHARARIDGDGFEIDPRERNVWVRHGLRALRSVAANASTMLGIVILIEWGFGLPGWGRQTVEAVLNRDVPWLMAIVVATAVLLGLVHVVVALGENVWLRVEGARRNGAA